MTRTRRLTPALAAALALALTAPAGAQIDGFTFEGSGCVESVAALAVPAENVAPDVPEGFTVWDVDGMALLGVGVLRCAAATVDGRATGSALVSDVGVVIDQPHNCAPPCGGQHFYQLWQVTDSPLLRARASALGIAGALVPGISMEVGALPGITQATASVPWVAAPYRLSTLTAPGAPAPAWASGTPNWWHDTRHGTARIQYSFPDGTTVGAGGATVDAEGGKLARLMGETSRQGAGLFIDASRIRGEAGLE